MASVQEYLEKQTTETLDTLLILEALGKDRFPLSTIYRICAILARRDPTRGNVRDLFLEFTRHYADMKEAADS